MGKFSTKFGENVAKNNIYHENNNDLLRNWYGSMHWCSDHYHVQIGYSANEISKEYTRSRLSQTPFFHLIIIFNPINNHQMYLTEIIGFPEETFLYRYELVWRNGYSAVCIRCCKHKFEISNAWTMNMNLHFFRRIAYNYNLTDDI